MRDIQPVIRSIPYIPNVPDLASSIVVHKQELSALSLNDTLSLLCRMFSHESSQVRGATLQKLHGVCVENREKIKTAMFEADVLSPDHPISLLLQDLLLLCRRETDRHVLVACAQCLGEIGAIDPTRVDIVLTASKLKHKRGHRVRDVLDLTVEDNVSHNHTSNAAGTSSTAGRKKAPFGATDRSSMLRNAHAMSEGSLVCCAHTHTILIAYVPSLTCAGLRRFYLIYHLSSIRIYIIYTSKCIISHVIHHTHRSYPQEAIVWRLGSSP